MVERVVLLLCGLTYFYTYNFYYLWFALTYQSFDSAHDDNTMTKW